MPGPEDILKQLGGKSKQKEDNNKASKEAINKALEDMRPPEGLPQPHGLLPCPCCGTSQWQYYQEKETHLPSVLCRCGTKIILDIDIHGKVMADNWNRRHNAQRAFDETMRWLTIVDRSIRDVEGKVHPEVDYDPYTFQLVMRFFQELIIRKHMLDENRVVCPFCGAPDFIDMKGQLRCANMGCSAIVPAEFFNCIMSGPHPHVYYHGRFEREDEDKKAVILRETVTPPAQEAAVKTGKSHATIRKSVRKQAVKKAAKPSPVVREKRQKPTKFTYGLGREFKRPRAKRKKAK